ncbi:MAG: YybH family protein [Alphaproteobacteria bacterium]
MKKLILVFLAVVLISPSVMADEVDDIRDLLETQAEAWSRGDLEVFMSVYWQSEDLRFASGGSITYGWQATLEGYQQRYDSPEKMGKLTFKDLDIRVFSGTHAYVFGRFELDRKVGDLTGLFTLLFEKRPEGWRIIADHSSESALPIMVLGE